jgi:hypothetical protein
MVNDALCSRDLGIGERVFRGAVCHHEATVAEKVNPAELVGSAKFAASGGSQYPRECCSGLLRRYCSPARWTRVQTDTRRRP